MQMDDEEYSQSINRDRDRWESGLQMRDASMTRDRDQSSSRDDAFANGEFYAGAYKRTRLTPQWCRLTHSGSDSIADSHMTSSTSQEGNSEQQQQVVQRSRWQAVLLEAGGIGAAVSEESMRRLKYCLQWLQVTVHQSSIDFHNLAHTNAVCYNTYRRPNSNTT